MRLLTVFLLAHALGYGALFAQANPSPGPVLVDDVPEGTNWVANASTRMYYRVGCPITIRIPAADRVYYKSESSLQAAGFKQSDQCDLTGAIDGQAVLPSRSSPAPVGNACTTSSGEVTRGDESVEGVLVQRRPGVWDS